MHEREDGQELIKTVEVGNLRLGGEGEVGVGGCGLERVQEVLEVAEGLPDRGGLGCFGVLIGLVVGFELGG